MLRLLGANRLVSLSRLRSLLGRSLSFKIMLASAVLVLPLSGAFWYRSLQLEKRNMTDNAAEFAASFSELVRKSVREQMLANDRDGVQRAIASIAGTEALATLRVYDRIGTIAFSSNPLEVGRRLAPSESPCSGCHDDPLRPHETLHASRRYTVTTGADGARVLSHVEPIYNEHACSTDACHAHAGGERVLGILLSEYPLWRLDQRVRRQVREFSLFVGIYVFALASLGYLIVWRVVLRPVDALSAGVEQVAAGNLAESVPVLSSDEIGRLAANFNAMTMELAASRRRMDRLTWGLEEQIATKTGDVRRTEARLAESQRLAALGRLTAEIAHEIRNPLTALGGYGRRLLRTVSSEAERESARIVVAEATRLEGLLKDVLDYSRTPRYEFVRQPLTPVVRESLAALGERCAERGVAVEADLAAEEPVFHDPGQVRRAVDNLVANAIDAMPGGGTLRVKTRLAAARGMSFVVVSVEDTGPGIAEDDIARIYEPFWTTKKMGEGTGLGLPITRKIAESHGGFLQVANRPGGGLSAALWLPYQDDEALAMTACWEELHCGRAGKDAPEPCPAWPHFGRACWAVAGTLRDGIPLGTQACRLGDCTHCDFYQRRHGR